MFWSSLGAQARVLQTVEGVEPFGFTEGYGRWVEVSAALWIERRLPAGSWVLGEGRWMVGLSFGGLRMEFTDLVDSGRKEGEVFVVGGLLCGEDEGQGSGVLGRWCSGGSGARVWDGFEVSVAGNFGGGAVGWYG